MVLKEAWETMSELFFCPLLFALAIVDFLPNPGRYLIRTIAGISSQQTGSRRRPKDLKHHTGRRILFPVDETSHEAVEWALDNMLEPWDDMVYLVYVPEGDFGQSTYRYPMNFNRYNYMDVLEGVDFLWEYCQRLDLKNVDFECMVVPMEPGKDIPSVILNKARAINPELVIMGASKRAGPEDVGATAFQVSLHSPVPVVVVR